MQPLNPHLFPGVKKPLAICTPLRLVRLLFGEILSDVFHKVFCCYLFDYAVGLFVEADAWPVIEEGGHLRLKVFLNLLNVGFDAFECCFALKVID